MTQSTTLPSDSTTILRARWQALRAEQPQLRIRNAAQQLGVSELELLVTEPETRVRRLEPECGAILQALAGLGPLMHLSRNDEVVHEITGTIKKLQLNDGGAMGLSLGEIDLRVFFRQWRHAYAVVETAAMGERHSLQFFSAAGEAVHKIYWIEGGDVSAWAALVDNHVATVQRPDITLSAPRIPTRSPLAEGGETALRADWAALQDVHDFHELLKRHGIDRLSALEQVGRDWAWPVAEGSLEGLLTRVAEQANPIMVFVGNPGIVQIYSGTIERLLRTGPWFNVLDPKFNLHVDTSAIAAIWVVRRPSSDGDITSLECFNRQGELVLTLFGARKPGVPERADWRERIAEVGA